MASVVETKDDGGGQEKTLYYVYPGFPFRGGYKYFAEYNAELRRFQDYLSVSRLKSRRLTYLCVGAPWEEQYANCSDLGHTEQRYQIFPEFLVRFTKLYPAVPVDLLVISPNNGFSPTEFTAPHIIETTPEFRWEFSAEERCYYSEKYQTRLMIFYSMMPHYNPKNVQSVHDRIEKMHREKGEDFFSDLLPFLSQGEVEKTKIQNFYKTLSCYVQDQIKIGGAVICFSFAVFARSTVHSDFFMFPDLKKIFMDKTVSDRTLLAEWVWQNYESNHVLIHGPDSENADPKSEQNPPLTYWPPSHPKVYHTVVCQPILFHEKKEEKDKDAIELLFFPSTGSRRNLEKKNKNKIRDHDDRIDSLADIETCSGFR